MDLHSVSYKQHKITPFIIASILVHVVVFVFAWYYSPTRALNVSKQNDVKALKSYLYQAQPKKVESSESESPEKTPELQQNIKVADSTDVQPVSTVNNEKDVEDAPNVEPTEKPLHEVTQAESQEVSINASNSTKVIYPTSEQLQALISEQTENRTYQSWSQQQASQPKRIGTLSAKSSNLPFADKSTKNFEIIAVDADGSQMVRSEFGCYKLKYNEFRDMVWLGTACPDAVNFRQKALKEAFKKHNLK